MSHLKVMIVPDSFKGSLSAREVIEVISGVLKERIENCEIVGIPIADGGEGTVDAVLFAMGGEKRNCLVQDPLGREITATYGVSDAVAVIEMAQASGLARLSSGEYNPTITSTYGTGQMVVHALDTGAKSLILGIGGSATNDGGTGFAKALGVNFFDEAGNLIQEEGAQILSRIRSVDLTGMDKRLKNIPITVICDVVNPLTGPEGATAVFSPQKGLRADQFDDVETGMINYRTVLGKIGGFDVGEIPGSGAAGGLGAALIALFGAQLKSGIDTMLDLVHFETRMAGVNLVITGEGRIDGQSIYGKVPVGVAKRCAKFGVKVVVIAGCDGPGVEDVYKYGISHIVTTVSRETPVAEAMAGAKENLKTATEKLVEILDEIFCV